MKYLSTCSLTVALLLGAVGRLPADIITFDELSAQFPNGTPADGLTVKGVTFGFSGSASGSTAAVFGSSGPGNTTFIQDPSLSGPTDGTLTMSFAVPTNSLQFGVLLSVFDPLPAAATVQLLDPSKSPVGVFTIGTNPIGSFTEGQFAYSGGPISTAVVTFDSADAGVFVLDNVSFDGTGNSTGADVASAPEPASITLLSLGSFGLLFLGRGRKALRTAAAFRLAACSV